MARAIAGANWRDAACYRRLIAGDRACFAWEWLRRSPDYVEAWSTGAAAAPFGLHRLEDPRHDSLVARPFWRADFCRSVLIGRACVALDSDDVLDLSRFTGLSSVLLRASSDPVDHLLLSDGLRSIRIDVIEGSLAEGPASMCWLFDGIVGARPQLKTLQQLIAVAANGRFMPSYHPPERRAGRWLDMLRVHDAQAVGAHYREIAAELFQLDLSAPRWRAEAAPWRLRVQRLAGSARVCLARPPADWLSEG